MAGVMSQDRVQQAEVTDCSYGYFAHTQNHYKKCRELK